MYIRVGPRDGGGVVGSLERPADCSGIYIERSGADAASTGSALLAAGAAVAIDGDHFLIAAAWLRARAGMLQYEPSWIRAFEAMVASVGSGNPYLAAMDAIRVAERRLAAPTAASHGKALAWITGVGLTPF